MSCSISNTGYFADIEYKNVDKHLDIFYFSLMIGYVSISSQGQPAYISWMAHCAMEHDP